MKKITLETNFEFCPKGHSWTFLPSSTMCYELFYCEKCDFFYTITVRAKTSTNINNEFCDGRADELKKYAKFLEWKRTLSYKDMELLANTQK